MGRQKGPTFQAKLPGNPVPFIKVQTVKSRRKHMENTVDSRSFLKRPRGFTCVYGSSCIEKGLFVFICSFWSEVISKKNINDEFTWIWGGACLVIKHVSGGRCCCTKLLAGWSKWKNKTILACCKVIVRRFSQRVLRWFGKWKCCMLNLKWFEYRKLCALGTSNHTFAVNWSVKSLATLRQSWKW